MVERDGGVAVKICGVTNAADALICAEAGAQMLGLNFSPKSLRCISPAVAREIIAAVRPRFAETSFVGVFVDQELEVVQTIAKELALDSVQLHGDEAPEYVRTLRAPFIIKAFRVRSDFAASSVNAYSCDAILLDSWNASMPGGTGETFDWSVAARLRPVVKRLILAGGLTPENVAEAVRMVRPFAVDVCSGVEGDRRRKNREKLRRFVEAVDAVQAVRA